MPKLVLSLTAIALTVLSFTTQARSEESAQKLSDSAVIQNPRTGSVGLVEWQLEQEAGGKLTEYGRVTITDQAPEANGPFTDNMIIVTFTNRDLKSVNLCGKARSTGKGLCVAGPALATTKEGQKLLNMAMRDTSELYALYLAQKYATLSPEPDDGITNTT